MDCKYKETSRVGLYILIIFILLFTCEVKDHTNRIEEKLSKIESMIGR